MASLAFDQRFGYIGASVPDVVVRILVVIPPGLLGVMWLVRPLWWLSFATRLRLYTLPEAEEWRTRIPPRLGLRIYGAITIMAAVEIVLRGFHTYSLMLGFVFGSAMFFYWGCNALGFLVRPIEWAKSAWSFPQIVSPKWTNITAVSQIMWWLRLRTLLTCIVCFCGAVGFMAMVLAGAPPFKEWWEENTTPFL